MWVYYVCLENSQFYFFEKFESVLFCISPQVVFAVYHFRCARWAEKAGIKWTEWKVMCSCVNNSRTVFSHINENQFFETFELWKCIFGAKYWDNRVCVPLFNYLFQYLMRVRWKINAKWKCFPIWSFTKIQVQRIERCGNWNSKRDQHKKLLSRDANNKW